MTLMRNTTVFPAMVIIQDHRRMILPLVTMTALVAVIFILAPQVATVTQEITAAISDIQQGASEVIKIFQIIFSSVVFALS